MKTPLATIGISFKNPGDYFHFALRSVFAQSFQDWELILLDDGSTDGSETLAATITDPRVTFEKDGLCRNLNVRLNQMVSMARGKYFFRMDADDIMHPLRIERQLAVLEKFSQDTIVGSAALLIDGSNKIKGIRPATPGHLVGFAARHRFIHPTVASTRKWFIENPYSENFIYHRAQDAELWCRTSRDCQFHLMPEPLLFYREINNFSFPNYLGSSMGILHLSHVYANGKLSFLKQLTLETAKIWLTTALYGCGRPDLVLNRRFHPISEAQRTEANAVLDSIVNHPLPQFR
jgi:glycosyltransferase involved in cell wall biosynthesis